MDKSKEYTFDMVWQALMESREQISYLTASQKETDRLQKENERILTEKLVETDKQQRETDKMIQSLSANNGAAEKELQEMRLQQKETDKILSEKFAETDKQQKETDRLQKENERILSEKFAETREQIRNLSININGIADSNGLVTEQTIYNALERDMSFAGINFEYIDKNKKRKIKSLNLNGEYDIILYNGDTIAIIEAKHRVRKEDVSKFASNQVEKFRKLFKEYKDYNVVLGIGGMCFDDGAEKEAELNGIGVIKVVGEKIEYNTDGIITHYSQ